MQALQRFEINEESASDYRMIESITLENFRCYEYVTLRDLKTVNVVVGRNGSGKTALLEAIYFTLGSPALSFKLRLWRGLGSQLHYSESTATRSGIWRDLFYNFDQDRTVKITFQGTADLARSVKISCRKQETQFVSAKKGQPLISHIPPITFEYFHAGQRLATVKPDFGGDGIQVTGTPEPLNGSFFPSVLPIDPQETAAHFSNLSKRGKEKPVVEALRVLFPMVESLSLELNANAPMVYAAVKGIAEKVPVGLVSTGVSKMLACLVAIANQQNGVIIIDEIENGLYYERMGQAWRVLLSFCRDNNVQLFASTHSSECLGALENVLSEQPEEFSLIRSVQTDTGCNLRHFQGKQFLSALEEDVEVR
ncbi:MAG: AAA family ATPase [Acidobacteria bacterium]|nr:AAA family ATPase [Acidobacteriota bacterium]